MIGSLRGVLAERNREGEVLIEVGGIGWRVNVTPATVAGLGDPGAEVHLQIHHHITDSSQLLFGFRTSEERRMFQAVLSAHGVGPSLAMAILEVHPPGALREVLVAEDVAALTSVPGVGKKTAARLVVDLKSKLVDMDLDLTSGAVGGGGGTSASADVREALTGLGYAEDDIRAALRDLPTDANSEELLKSALQRLAAKT